LPVKICLLSVEIFAWGKYGGFGRATRNIGRELARLGHEVSAITPRRESQGEVETLDGITVLGYSQYRPWDIYRLAKSCQADVYHSCEPSLATYIARRAAPDSVHIVTARDPRDWKDWRVELTLPSKNRVRTVASMFFENNLLATHAVRKADAVYTAFNDAIPKVKAKYGLAEDPRFLATPTLLPTQPTKSGTPKVCFVARLDRRKRPHLFMDLADRFPKVEFVALGAARNSNWEQELRQTYGARANLTIAGFVDQFRSPYYAEVLSQSWILINTSVREGLPNAFIEAAAHGCAILSSVDTDGFASRFGETVSNDDFATGLRALLENDRWRECGARARSFVAETFETEVAIKSHIDAYEDALSAAGTRPE
jgi:glycosyltransferase involved in cell wall biosynthesis